MTVGERIYYCRTENHMTQKELGEKTGIASATIGRYERGVLNPKISTLQKIAAALGVEWVDLYPDTDAASKAYIDEANAFTKKNGGLRKIGYDEAAERGFIDKETASNLNTMNDQIQCKNMMNDYAQLNETGRTEAAKRVHELTFLPEYRKEPTEK